MHKRHGRAFVPYERAKVNIPTWPFEDITHWQLFRRLKLALQPAKCLICFQRVGALAIEALERALPFTARRQRESQIRPAMGAGWSFAPSHATILPLVRKFVNSKFKTGHCAFQIGPLRIETGQYPK
jgi:hypothetical protein